MKPPAKNPCGSCPYRQDSPVGLWHPDEYHKLPGYDLDTFAQPQGVFGCHQQDDHLCAGWVGTHDMSQNLALRLAASMGHMTPEEYEETLGYETDTPLFASGEEARDHGIGEADERARRTMSNFKRKGLDVRYADEGEK